MAAPTGLFCFLARARSFSVPLWRAVTPIPLSSGIRRPSGTDLWLDDAQVAQSVPWSPTAPTGQVMLLHDGTSFGAAQCWLHEAAEWNRTLSDRDVPAVLSYAERWVRGKRKGLYLLFNGQSNAINYSMNDGAAALLAQGIAWYLGALAYNVLATTGSSDKLYDAKRPRHLCGRRAAGYPGSFVQDPGDGSSPSTWQLGADGLAVQQAVAGLPAEDLADLCAIIWPWNETDSLRQYSEYNTFEAAALRFLSLLRSMLGDTSNSIPLVWWNAIPYGYSGWHNDASAGRSKYRCPTEIKMLLSVIRRPATAILADRRGIRQRASRRAGIRLTETVLIINALPCWRRPLSRKRSRPAGYAEFNSALPAAVCPRSAARPSCMCIRQIQHDTHHYCRP